jgi:hypothetical protein
LNYLKKKSIGCPDKKETLWKNDSPISPHSDMFNSQKGRGEETKGRRIICQLEECAVYSALGMNSGQTIVLTAQAEKQIIGNRCTRV